MIKEKEPLWCEALRRELSEMAVELTGTLRGWEAKLLVATPEQFGYHCGMATEYIQKAIDYIAGNGGGRVLLEHGDYLSGTVELASDVCLEIGKGARLLGSRELKDYPDHVASRRTVMDTHMGMHKSLIFAEGCRNIAICGEGTIDGQGTRENFPGEETICATPGRPFLMRIIDCIGVHIKDITITNPACWTQDYLNCEKVLLERVTVESQSNYNNDGIDLDGCREVIVRNCYVSSGDDALCIKGASQKETNRILIEDSTLFSSCNAVKLGTDTQGDFRNILLRNCTVGGTDENMRRIKHAYADSGISWEAVDGGTVERIWACNLRIIRAFSPFFIRLGKRGRVKPEDAEPGISRIRKILMENITGTDNGARGSYFLGIPERCVEDIVLRNVKLEQKPSRKKLVHSSDIPVMYEKYPDAHMIDDIGDAPAYALWARDVTSLTLIDYEVITGKDEMRPEFILHAE